jgi:hypothetical protein
VVGKLLKEQDYSLQANVKVLEGNQSPDRNAQFEHINDSVTAAMKANQPVISVDTKKKELVGAYKNAGQEWLPSGEPVKVKVHDFIDKELGRANPYGVYDIGADEAWVSVGTDHDTSAFAVQTIRRWWFSMGSLRYPQAKQLVITADGGGSNGHRARLWKLELSRFAQETGLAIQVHHFPPGTSKWNKIEHRLFSFITMNWRGQPLISHEVIVNLIASTKTRSGLAVRSEIDNAQYPKGMSVSDADLAAIKIERDEFHGDWNGCNSHTDARRAGNGRTFFGSDTSFLYSAEINFHAASKRSLWARARKVRMAWPPSLVQRWPDRFMRWVTRVLQVASMTPEPIGKFCARNRA